MARRDTMSHLVEGLTPVAAVLEVSEPAVGYGSSADGSSVGPWTEDTGPWFAGQLGKSAD